MSRSTKMSGNAMTKPSGRLVAPDLGFGADTEAESVADDICFSGGAASAEEAAVHIIDGED
ncbi:MAG: DUF5709 domain-containing protein [Actinomycetota bacterium]|nr:DUF5709 domain-containing protein [Actinomycetota bacterium]